jgi:2'-5' RNA ligase
VVYLGLEPGRDEIERIPGLLARAALASDEPYPFHPHITLAQDFPAERLDEVTQLARHRWADWKRERSFVVDRLSFVQGIDLCTWTTVREYDLNRSPIR